MYTYIHIYVYTYIFVFIYVLKQMRRPELIPFPTPLPRRDVHQGFYSIYLFIIYTCIETNTSAWTQFFFLCLSPGATCTKASTTCSPRRLYTYVLEPLHWPESNASPLPRRDVHQGFYYVLTRDEAVLACAMLKRYAPDCAELGCLVVSPRCTLPSRILWVKYIDGNEIGIDH